MSRLRTRRACARFSLPVACLFTVFAVVTAAHADDWNEAIDGDLSSDPNAPTPLTVTVGVNKLTGTVQATGGDTRDYVTFTVPPDTELTGIIQIDYFDVNTSGPGDRGWHSINAGSTSFVPSGSTAGSFLGGNHLDPQPSGTNMLPTLGTAPLAGTGFTPPLGPGDYTYLVQQTGAELTGYEIDLVLASTASPVPVLGPAAIGLLGSGLAASGLVWARRRGRRSA